MESQSHQSVSVKLDASWRNDGKFLCSPKLCGEELEYTVFLSDLNNHFIRKPTSSYTPEVGEYVAVYDPNEENPLWYRGKVQQLCPTNTGTMVKIALVDKGEEQYAPAIRVRKLPEKFMKYPHQLMSCMLHDIVPITMGLQDDLHAAVRKTKIWDSSALKEMEQLIKDSELSIKVEIIDDNNVHHVVLYSDNLININKHLVNEGYATHKSTDDATLKQQSLQQGQIRLDSLVLSERREREKEKKRQEYKEKAEKEQREVSKLLGLLHQPSSSSLKNPKLEESSETSDLSDIEKSPAPHLSNYKEARPKLSNSGAVEEKLGKKSVNYLQSRLEGIEISKPPSTKSVSFSPDILAGKSTQCEKEEKVSKSQTNIVPGALHPPPEELPASKNVGPNFILKQMCVDPTKQDARKTVAKSMDDDVLVYGKMQRNPFHNIDQLNLPQFFKTCLTEENITKPSPFQAHMWPAMAAFRNTVGISDYGTSTTSRVLAYLLPILRNMVEKDGDYATLGKGNSPFLIVCVADWQEARKVFEITENFLKYYRKIVRFDVRYGGMDQISERDVRLINGCDILIATVPSLNHVLSRNCIKLNRLCHLVFDNADILVETFTEEIKQFMRTYYETIKTLPSINKQMVAVGRKWTYGIHSLMNNYFAALDEPLVIIANRIEAALFVKVPMVPEICNSANRLEHLVAFLESEASDENSIIFTNSAKGAEELQDILKSCSIMASVITDFTETIDVNSTVKAWKSACLKSKGNCLILSDYAIAKAKIKNASCIIHFDYPQKKSHFGKRMSCLLDTIRANEGQESPKPLYCQIFITEKNNGVRYCTGLVKLLKRSGQKVPEKLQSMANSSYELKEEQKEYSQLCSRLKLFGECKFIDDCSERHTIFKDRDLLGLCPSTGFVKVIILDVINASSFWGRIIEHSLPHDPEGSSYDSSVYLQLQLDMQMFYSVEKNRVLCANVERYDICVMNTAEHGYQRVQIIDILEKEYERPKILQVFGIDNGFTAKENASKMYVCAENFLKFPHQAVEVIACCVKPVEKGATWTNEASEDIDMKTRGKTLEGRVQFSLQNTIWVDPLVEKKMLSGIQTKAYSLDIGRDLINLGYAERNLKHVEKLRKLLYDVQGHPIEVTTNKQNLPLSMIDHEVSFLPDDEYEQVFVTAVVDPGCFFVQRSGMKKNIQALDDKIDATMKVKKTGLELAQTTFPVGYICVAIFSGDQKWYRAKVMGLSKDRMCYDIFFVDHGDREFVGKSKVSQAWPDIIPLPFQAIECYFTNITPIDDEWTDEDGDMMWDLCEGKMLTLKVVTLTPSSYIPDTVRYDIELFDTTQTQTENINHELVFVGVARGSLQCIQQMFPHASISSNGEKVIADEWDKCPDLCVDIHQEHSVVKKVELAEILKKTVSLAPREGNILIENGTIESITKLIALSKKTQVQEILLSILIDLVNNESYGVAFEDHDGVKALCDILKKTDSEKVKTQVIQLIHDTANDEWSHHVLGQMSYLDGLCSIIKECNNSIASATVTTTELLINVLDSLSYFCRGNSDNCDSVRHADGLKAICELYDNYNDTKVVERCTDALKALLANGRNKDRIREDGDLQVLASLYKRDLNEATIKNLLSILVLCIEDNEENRDYLHKVNCHQNLTMYSKSPRKLTMQTRLLLTQLIQQLTPAPLKDCFITVEDGNDQHVCLYEDDKVDDDVILEMKAPMTVWSQRRNFITISIQLRGVQRDETTVNGKSLYFRTVMNPVEYVLDIELYAEVHGGDDAMVSIKGGEVIIQLCKMTPGEIWPRLLDTEDKCPYIGVDFDRWVDEFPPSEKAKVSDGTILFQPDLPLPPQCKSYDPDAICVDDPNIFSSGSSSYSSSDDEENMVENRGANDPDYFAF